MKHIYQAKQAEYYACVRLDLVSLIPNNPEQKLLEIGASGGYTLCLIKERALAKEVAGVELFDMPETQQKSSLIDKFIVANIESDLIDLPPEYYDTIICGDVLEHLSDPWSVVSKLSNMLKPGGTFIVSVPNIREIKTLVKIVCRGDFGYEESGILDKTHLRFFCKKNALALLTTSSLKPVAYHSSLDMMTSLNKKKILNLLTFGVLKEFLTVQHIVVSQKSR